MAPRLIRWLSVLGILVAAIAALLLPPGRLVRQAEAPLRSVGVALGWVEPTDMDAERAYRRASEARGRARRAFEEEVLVQYAWQVADALADSLEASRESGEQVLLLTLDPSVGALDFGDVAVEYGACSADELRFAVEVDVDLEASGCEFDGSPAARYVFELTEPTPFVVSASGSSGRPRLRLDGGALGRPIFDAATSYRESRIALVLAPGRYDLDVFAEAGDVPAGVVVAAETPSGEPLLPGSSVETASDPEGYHRPVLEAGRQYALRLAPGVSLLDGQGLRDGPGVFLVDGGESQLVHVHSSGGAANLVELSTPLARSGATLDFGEPVEWNPGESGLGAFVFEQEDWRSVTVEVRSGDGVTPVPARSWIVASSGASPVSAERPRPPGLYGVVVALDDVASGLDGERLRVALRCAAAVVPAVPDVLVEWEGPPECSPDTGASTAWRVEFDEGRVVEAEWQGGGGGAATAYSAERDGYQRSLRWGAAQLPPGVTHVVATGEAARSIVLRDRGRLEDHQRRMLAATVDSAASGSPQARVALAFAPAPAVEGYVRLRGSPVLAGVSEGEPFCAVVRTGASLGWAPGWRDASELGICGFYARFGRPGSSMERWLDAGGAGFGARAPIEDAERAMVRDEFSDRGPLGMVPVLPYVTFSAHTEACLEGDARRCDRAWEVTSDAVTARTPLIGVSELDWELPLYGMSMFVLATLRRDFGDEAFARFWEAEEPLETAFETAFGLDRGEWTRRFAVRSLGPRTGRGSVWTDGLFALLLAALLALAAARANVRRSVP